MFENTFLWAQVIGFAALICSLISMQIKNPRHVVLSFVPSDALLAIQYALLGAPMGTIMHINGTLKNLFIPFISKKYVPHLLWGYLLVVWSIGLYNLDAWYGLLSIIGGSVSSVALLINRDNRALYARSVILCCLLWVCYNFIVGSYMGLACNALLITSSVIGMARHENWEIGKCYKSFLPSIMRALIIFQGPRTYP